MKNLILILTLLFSTVSNAQGFAFTPDTKTKMLDASYGFVLGNVTNAILETTPLNRFHYPLVMLASTVILGTIVETYNFDHTGKWTINHFVYINVGGIASVVVMHLREDLRERKEEKLSLKIL